jgi:Cu+-exporting ATPase
VQADIDGKTVLVGSRGFLMQRGVDKQGWEAPAQAWRTEAKTVVFFAVNGIAMGLCLSNVC